MNTRNIAYIPAAGGSVQKVAGCTHLTKITPQMTGGAFLALVADIPVNCGPPMHTHDQDAEWSFVLQGQITFETPEGVVVAGPGDSVFLPAGGSHAFCNRGTETARVLLVAPGARVHAFFEEMDAKLHGEVIPPLMVQIASRYGITLCPPSAAQTQAS